MSTSVVVIIWALFFLTTVYGHIGLKLAVSKPTAMIKVEPSSEYCILSDPFT